MQFSASWCNVCAGLINLVQFGVGWCNFVHVGVTWCRLVQLGADWCNFVECFVVLLQRGANCCVLVEIGAT